MALSDLIAKILNDAKKDVAQIEADTAKNIENLENEYEQKTQDRKVEIEASTAKRKEAMLKKVKMLGETERRNAILNAKQEVINQVFEQSVEKLMNLPEAEYEKIIVALFEKTGNIQGAVFHSPKGKENITISAMKKAKMAYKQGSSIDIQGGFTLTSDTIDIDNSIENLVKKELRQQIQLELSKTLF